MSQIPSKPTPPARDLAREARHLILRRLFGPPAQLASALVRRRHVRLTCRDHWPSIWIRSEYQCRPTSLSAGLDRYLDGCLVTGVVAPLR